jgi:uncharacterized repeat protein (TIGR02543 family)
LVACGGSNDVSLDMPSFPEDASADGVSSMADSGAAGSVRVIEGGTPGACVPGQQIACPCLGGSNGIQACKADGTGFDACQCLGDSGPSGPDGGVGPGDAPGAQDVSTGSDSSVAPDGSAPSDASALADNSSDQDQTGRDASAPDVAADAAAGDSGSGTDTGSASPDATSPDASGSADAAAASHDLHASIAGGTGSIALSPQGTSCGASCASYPDGTNVLLFAVPDAGYQFIYWSGDCSGSGAATNVSMTANKTCVANVAPMLTVVVDKGGGTVSDSLGGINGCKDQCSEPVSPGAVVKLSATPAQGYTFSQWAGDCAGTNPVIDVTMNAAKTCHALFTPQPYTLTVSVAGGVGGEIIYGSQSICSNTCMQQVFYGQGTKLFASASYGYRFAGWSGDCSGNAPDYALSITGNASCTATFAVDEAGTPPYDGGLPPGCNEPASKCATCACSTCGGPFAACSNDQGCVALSNCVSQYGCTTEPSCVCSALILQYGDVALLHYQKFSACMSGPCASSCPSGGDAGSGETSTQSCNSLVNSGPVVDGVAIPADLPTNWQGGKIPDGTYYVTQLMHFTGTGGASGPTGETFQETAVFSGATGQIVYQSGTVDAGLDPEAHGTYAIKQGQTPSQIIFFWACGGQGSIVEDYTVSAPDGGAVTVTAHPMDDVVVVLTKQ